MFGFSDEDMKILRSLTSLVSLSALAAASRSILSEDRRTFIGFMRGLILAVFVGAIALLMLNDTTFSASFQGGIVGVTAFVADDILLFIIAFTHQIRDNPGEILDWILRRNSFPANRRTPGDDE